MTPFVYWHEALRLNGNWLVLFTSLVRWVNDLWMADLFFLVRLEIKREVLRGKLATMRKALLPADAALGGIRYSAQNWRVWRPVANEDFGRLEFSMHKNCIDAARSDPV